MARHLYLERSVRERRSGEYWPGRLAPRCCCALLLEPELARAFAYSPICHSRRNASHCAHAVGATGPRVGWWLYRSLGANGHHRLDPGLWRVERVRCIGWLLALEATEERGYPCACSLALLLVLCNRLAGPIYVDHRGAESNCAGLRLEECALSKAGPASTESDRRHHRSIQLQETIAAENLSRDFIALSTVYCPRLTSSSRAPTPPQIFPLPSPPYSHTPPRRRLA